MSTASMQSEYQSEAENEQHPAECSFKTEAHVGLWV